MIYVACVIDENPFIVLKMIRYVIDFISYSFYKDYIRDRSPLGYVEITRSFTLSL